jgi:hypothetical protein
VGSQDQPSHRNLLREPQDSTYSCLCGCGLQQQDIAEPAFVKRNIGPGVGGELGRLGRAFRIFSLGVMQDTLRYQQPPNAGSVKEFTET